MEIKTDINGLYKDSVSGGLINKDNIALSAYKRQKDTLRSIRALEHRVEELERKINVLLSKH